MVETATTDSQPRTTRWWQWFLLYPSFGVALVSATPVVADKALAVLNDTDTATFSEAERQRTLWEKNLACSAGARLEPQSIPGSVNKIGTVACPSGDVLVQATAADLRSGYYWVAFDDVVRPVASGGLGLIPQAKASGRIAPRPARPAAARSPGGARLQLAMQAEQAICQRVVDGRTLVRRVKTAAGCFDEYIDMYSGAVTVRRAAPCTPSC